MLSKTPSPRSSEHVFAMTAAPPVPAYDHNDPMALIKHLRTLNIAAGRPNPFPTPPSLLCARVSFKELGSLGKR